MSNQNNVYFYPHSSKISREEKNPYIDLFLESLNKQVNVLNYDNATSKGVFDLINYVKEADLIVLNWAENIPDKSVGKIQTLVLLLLLRFKKLFNVRILWILHNKLSHSNTNIYWKKLIFRALLIKSDLIVTHSKSGINYANEFLKKDCSNILYIPHPSYKSANNNSHPTLQKYDILLWGTMAPYKGVLEFLQMMHQHKLHEKYSIKIIGKFSSDAYYNSVNVFGTENIDIENRFAEDEELLLYFKQTKLILFTYEADSVLSSGALIKSLDSNAIILGPNIGAFSDLGQENIIDVYNSPEEMWTKIDFLLSNKTETQKQIDLRNAFLKENNWENFIEKILNLIKK